MQKRMDRLHPGRLLVGTLVLVMACGLALQHQEIRRLESFSHIQTVLLSQQQALAFDAVRHLELIRRYNVPYRYLEALDHASREYDLNLEFLVGLMQVESNFDPNAQSNKAAYGLMQVKYDTAREIDPSLQSYWQLFDPDRNIQLGAAYFRKLLDRYDGDYRVAALAYNRGPTRVDGEMLGDGLLSDRYWRKILAAGIVN